jgi:hypothetical protein
MHFTPLVNKKLWSLEFILHINMVTSRKLPHTRSRITMDRRRAVTHQIADSRFIWLVLICSETKVLLAVASDCLF